MKFILGVKSEMSQVWQNDRRIAVTRVKVGTCVVTQVKTKAVDGYEAVQVGFGERKAKNIAKPQQGHMKDLGNFRYLREFRLEEATDLKVGDKFDASTFEPGDEVQAEGISKGRGFQGVVKRHGFHGQDKTHGNKDQLRMPGSIGATGPAHVFKGQKMPGHMGTDQVTIKGLKIIEVDVENNMISINCGLPGAREGLILISGEGELKLAEEKVEEVKEETPVEEVKVEEKVEEVKEEVKEETKTEETPVEEKKEEVKVEEVPVEEKKEEVKVEEPKKEEEKKDNKEEVKEENK